MNDFDRNNAAPNDEDGLRRYYAMRAGEYEAVYEKPERQEDLTRIAGMLPPFFAGRRVLEVAAGTGYWTQRIAPSARSVVAVDINPEPLAIARTKQLPRDRVRFAVADAFALSAIEGDFDAGFAGFWWSHLTCDDLARFLDGFHSRLKPGARVAFLDNRYVEASSSPIAYRDADGNTYQDRPLADGSIHRVLKNFPATAEIVHALGDRAENPIVHEFPYYWLVVYRTAA